jgi:flagellar biosynthesis anti-sigma factor FlgM
MKIEGQRPDQLPAPNQAAQTSSSQAAQGAERTQASPRTERPGRPTEAQADRVDLSPDARLMESAVRAVEKTPAVRQDVVERVRAKLAAGEVGNDPVRLADRIIDSLLSR